MDDLSPIGYTLIYHNYNLLSAFSERWHEKSSNFHLSVGEMTMALDDMSYLMHLPICLLNHDEKHTRAAKVNLMVELIGF